MGRHPAPDRKMLSVMNVLKVLVGLALGIAVLSQMVRVRNQTRGTCRRLLMDLEKGDPKSDPDPGCFLCHPCASKGKRIKCGCCMLLSIASLAAAAYPLYYEIKKVVDKARKDAEEGFGGLKKEATDAYESLEKTVIELLDNLTELVTLLNERNPADIASFAQGFVGGIIPDETYQEVLDHPDLTDDAQQDIVREVQRESVRQAAAVQTSSVTSAGTRQTAIPIHEIELPTAIPIQATVTAEEAIVTEEENTDLADDAQSKLTGTFSAGGRRLYSPEEIQKRIREGMKRRKEKNPKQRRKIKK